MLGSANSPIALLRDKRRAMFPDRLQCAKRPAESLPHQPLGVDGRLGKRQRPVFVDHLQPLLQQAHRQVGIFGYRVQRITARSLNRARCAMRQSLREPRLRH